MNPSQLILSAGIASFLGMLAPTIHAGTPAKKTTDECCELNLWTGEGVSLGNIIFPEFNYQAAAGSATTDPERLAVGHHDPNRHGITQQNIELSVGANLGKYLRLFGNYNAVIGQDDHWFAEFEEHYGVISGLPLGIELKGGRFFTTFGYHNREHLHDFTFVDKYLANGRLIGEDSASIYGGEISLPLFGRVLPEKWSDRFVFSYGTVPDPMEEGHEEEEEESEFEGEGALWQDNLATADYTLTYAIDDATQCAFGISGAWGRNNFGRHTQLYGAHLDYLWRPAGAAHAEECCHKERAEFFRWRTEAMVRQFGAIGGHSEEEEHVAGGGADDSREEASGVRDDFTDFGIHTTFSYGFPNGKWQAHLRGEYVSSVPEAGLEERYRISPALTWHPTEKLPIHFKLQYNYDHFPSSGDEHSVWLQFSLTWGDCCAHEH